MFVVLFLFIEWEAPTCRPDGSPLKNQSIMLYNQAPNMNTNPSPQRNTKIEPQEGDVAPWKYSILGRIRCTTGGASDKEPTCQYAGDRHEEIPVKFLGGEDPLEKGMATHSSILAERIPRTEGPGGLRSMGPRRVRHNRRDWVCVQWLKSETHLRRYTEVSVAALWKEVCTGKIEL